MQMDSKCRWLFNVTDMVQLLECNCLLVDRHGSCHALINLSSSQDPIGSTFRRKILMLSLVSVESDKTGKWNRSQSGTRQPQILIQFNRFEHFLLQRKNISSKEGRQVLAAVMKVLKFQGSCLKFLAASNSSRFPSVPYTLLGFASPHRRSGLRLPQVHPRGRLASEGCYLAPGDI